MSTKEQIIKVESNIQYLREVESKKYEDRARDARYSNDMSSAQYYEGMRQGILLACLKISEKTK